MVNCNQKSRKADKRMKKRIRKVAMAILIVVFVVSTALSLRQWMDNTDGEATYKDAMAIAMQTAPDNAVSMPYM